MKLYRAVLTLDLFAESEEDYRKKIESLTPDRVNYHIRHMPYPQDVYEVSLPDPNSKNHPPNNTLEDRKNNPNTSWSKSQVAEMARLRLGGVTFVEIGRRAGVTGGTISRVLWKRVRQERHSRFPEDQKICIGVYEYERGGGQMGQR